MLRLFFYFTSKKIKKTEQINNWIKPLITLLFTMILDNKGTRINSNGTFLGNKLINLLNS